MKKLLMAMIGVVLLLGACGGADEPAPDETPTETPAETDETATGDFDATQAESSYASCIGCHGGNLEGQGDFPSIKGLPYEQVITAIQEGPGAMPPNLVEGEDAENLAAWVAAQ